MALRGITELQVRFTKPYLETETTLRLAASSPEAGEPEDTDEATLLAYFRETGRQAGLQAERLTIETTTR